MPSPPVSAPLCKTCIAFTPEQRDRLEKAAAANGRTSMAVIVRRLVDAHLDDLLASN